MLTPGLDPARPRAVVARCLVALALVYVMVAVSSPDAVDVIYAVMEGATRLIHGVLPYGHMPPGIIHGDTYPILSYALYTPLALVAPVNNVWNSVDGGLARRGARGCLSPVGPCSGDRRRAPAGGVREAVEVEEAGLRAALAGSRSRRC